MTSRQGHTHPPDPVAVRCLEVLDQMTAQLVGGRTWKPHDKERLERIKADLTKLVHWALHDHGDPDVVARIRDCYRRCAVDIDDTAVLRRVRGVMKGELRKAGIDTAVPGLDPALDAQTIILTTRRTVQRMGGASSSTSAPGPALDRKPPSSDTMPVAPPAPPALQPAARPATVRTAKPATVRTAKPATVRTAKPATVRAAKPPTVRTVAKPPAAEQRRTATPAEVRAAFDQVVAQTLAMLQRSGHRVDRADYLAAIYNDPAKKSRLIDQVADQLPPSDRSLLTKAVDGFFRDGFKGAYIERTDRQGNRRAHKR